MDNIVFNNTANDLRKIKDDSIKMFGNLSSSQLNWKPSIDKWSIGQCFDHIIITNEKYFPEINDLIKGIRKNNFWAKVPFLPRMFGKLFIDTMSPSKNRKVKAPKSLLPSRSNIGQDIIEKFARHQDVLIEKINQMKDLDPDPDKIIITSAVTKYITYSLNDTMTLFSLHERRHFTQAENVSTSERFPKS